MKAILPRSSHWVGMLLVLLTGNLLAAPMGTVFSYQGRLQQSGGPANGLYDFQFSLWDAVNSGNLIGVPQAVVSVTVSNGLFIVPLDFGPGSFSGGARWLEIDVRTNGGSPFIALSPRQPLLPTPYSIMSSAASNLLGTLPAAQLSGTLPASALAGYSGAVVFTNPASTFIGAFIGDGGGLTNLALAGRAIHPLSDTVVPGQHRPLKAKIGWNSWYDCYTSVYGSALTNIANQFISWGLRDAGWVWIGIDDGWYDGRDATTHRLIPDPGMYPQGMRALADGIHSMGFKLGLYTSFPYCGAPGYESTGNYPVQDAQTMCDWNVDCLKFDGMGAASWMSTFYDTVQTLYLSNSRAPLYIETYCTPTDSFGVYQDPRLKYWATSQLASRDWVKDIDYFLSRFESELGAGHDYFSSFVPAAGLLICTNLAPVPPTNAYNAIKAQMSVLAMLSADMVANSFNPGYPSNYLYKPPAEVLTAMKNTNVLAIHQDPAQVTGWPIIHDTNKVVWLKPLGTVDGPEWAVTIWNPNTTTWSTNTFSLTNLPGLFTGTWRAVELWSMTTQIVSTVITCTNVPYEPKMYRLTPTWMH